MTSRLDAEILSTIHAATKRNEFRFTDYYDDRTHVARIRALKNENLLLEVKTVKEEGRRVTVYRISMLGAEIAVGVRSFGR